MRNLTSDCTTSSHAPTTNHAPTTTHATTAAPHVSPSRTVVAADSALWFITEKGLRAEGAASMRAMAARLRESAAELERAARRLGQEVPPPPSDGGGEPEALEERRGTVCGRYRNERRVLDLRLSGLWLERAGFNRGRKFDVQVHSGRITLRAQPTMAC